MKKYYIVLIILLIVNIYILYDIDKNGGNSKSKSLQTKQITEQKVILDWEATIKKNDNFVFLGDSIIDWYPISEMYDKAIPIINSGIAGYETHDILDRMDEMVYRYNPTKVFLLIGTNDLKYKDNKDDEEEVAKNIEKIITQIKENRPKAKIYVQSIYPVNREMKNNASEERYNEEIKEVNKKVESYCKDNDITYINMYDLLKDDNDNFNETYTNDGLHPNTLGYITITKKLMQYMN